MCVTSLDLMWQVAVRAGGVQAVRLLPCLLPLANLTFANLVPDSCCAITQHTMLLAMARELAVGTPYKAPHVSARCAVRSAPTAQL